MHVGSNRARAEELLAAFSKAGPPSRATPWDLFYSLMARGSDFPYPARESDSCRRWLLEEATWKPAFMGSAIAREIDGHAMFLGDLERGRPPGLEGHFCQWLFVLSEIGATPGMRVRLPPDGREGTLEDIIEGSRAQCNTASDLSWALPVLTRWYRGPWKNRFGEGYDADALAEQHLRQKGTSVVCMGAHWRIGIASALSESPGVFSSGTRKRLQDSISECLREVERSCDSDGRLVLAGMPERTVEAVTTYQAHTLEWVLMTMTAEDVRASDWVNRAIARLEQNQARPELSHGTRCHASFALRLYLQRVGTPVRLNPMTSVGERRTPR